MTHHILFSRIWAVGTLFGTKLVASGAPLIGIESAVRRGAKAMEGAA